MADVSTAALQSSSTFLPHNGERLEAHCPGKRNVQSRKGESQKQHYLQVVFNEKIQDDLGGSEVKVPASNVGDPGSIPGLGRSPGEGNGSPLQYSCLENSKDRGAWWATVHVVVKSQTRLSS